MFSTKHALAWILTLGLTAGAWAQAPATKTIVVRPAAKKQTVTYLGLVTEPVSAELRAQLGIPAGVGLLVQHVMPGSPADKAGVKQYDVLHKLRDQLLVNHDQLRILIRQHKKGDKMPLTLFRGGKSVKVEAVADQREALVQPPGATPTIRVGPDTKWADVNKLMDDVEGLELHFVVPPGGAGGAAGRDAQLDEMRKRIEQKLKELDVHMQVGPDGKVDLDQLRQRIQKQLEEAMKGLNQAGLQKRMQKQLQDMDIDVDVDVQVDGGAKIDADKIRKRIQEQMDKAMKEHRQAIHKLRLQVGPGAANMRAVATSMASYSDGTHTLTVKTDQNGKRLTVKDANGKVIFDGPIDTDAQKQKVPAEVREKLKRLESNTRVKVRIQPFNGPRPAAPREPSGQPPVQRI